MFYLMKNYVKILYTRKHLKTLIKKKNFIVFKTVVFRCSIAHRARYFELQISRLNYFPI